MKKKIFVFIVIVMIMLMSIIYYVPSAKVNADGGETTCLAVAQYSSHVNTWTIYAVYNENTQRFYFNETPSVLTDYNEDSDTYYYGQLVLMTYQPYTSSLIQVDSVTNDLSQVNTILTDLYDVRYNDGYTAGVNATYSSAYEQGYNQGYDGGYKDGDDHGIVTGRSEYAVGTTKYNAIFQAGEDVGEERGYSIGYQKAINDGVTGGSAFYNMLKNIATYPVRIFSEGLDVEIFGVNVGGFLLGVAMIFIVVTIIKLVLGGR